MERFNRINDTLKAMPNNYIASVKVDIQQQHQGRYGLQIRNLKNDPAYHRNFEDNLPFFLQTLGKARVVIVDSLTQPGYQTPVRNG